MANIVCARLRNAARGDTCVVVANACAGICNGSRVELECKLRCLVAQARPSQLHVVCSAKSFRTEASRLRRGPDAGEGGDVGIPTPGKKRAPHASRRSRATAGRSYRNDGGDPCSEHDDAGSPGGVLKVSLRTRPAVSGDHPGASPTNAEAGRLPGPQSAEDRRSREGRRAEQRKSPAALPGITDIRSHMAQRALRAANRAASWPRSPRGSAMRMPGCDSALRPR